MLCYYFWKNLIDDIKVGFSDTLDYALEMFWLVIFTPILAIIDIIISPYSICCLIVNIIQKQR